MSTHTLEALTFARDGDAWFPLNPEAQGMARWRKNQPRYVPRVAHTSDADLTIHDDTVEIGGTDYRVLPLGAAMGFMFAAAMTDAGVFQAGIYKSADGGATWALADDAALTFDAISCFTAVLIGRVGQEVYTGAVDAAGDLTWTRSQDGAAGDFSLPLNDSTNLQSTISDWSIMETRAHTLLLLPYSGGATPPDPQVFRSTDDGANFVSVQTISGPDHFHRGLQMDSGRIVASMGDGAAAEIRSSDDDGATFDELIANGVLFMQPVGLALSGRANYMLMGNDSIAWPGVAEMDVSPTPPLTSALDVRPVCQFRDDTGSSQVHNYCWAMCNALGTIYAVSGDQGIDVAAAATQDMLVYVSPHGDGRHWAPYLRIPPLSGTGKAAKIMRLFGAGGRIHAHVIWQDAATHGSAQQRWVSWASAEARLEQALLIEPDTTNHAPADDEGRGEISVNSADDFWIQVSSSGGGVAPTVSIDDDGYVEGAGARKGAWAPAGGQLAVGCKFHVGKKTGDPPWQFAAMYSGRANGLAAYIGYYAQAAGFTNRYITFCSPNWTELRSRIVNSAGNAGFKAYLVNNVGGSITWVDAAGTAELELRIAAPMAVNGGLMTSWCLGSRARETLVQALTVGSAWRHAYTFRTDHDSEFDVDPLAGNAWTFCYRGAADSLGVLYEDGKWSLRTRIGGSVATVVADAATPFLRGEQLTFALIVTGSGVTLTIGRMYGDEVTLSAAVDTSGLLNGALTIYSGNALTGTAQTGLLSMFLLDSTFDDSYRPAAGAGGAGIIGG